MAERKTSAYWLLLPLAFLLLALALLVQPTQARYTNTMVWNTVLYPVQTQADSNCLTEDGQTILLGRIDRDDTGAIVPAEFTFTVSSLTKGTLTAEVSMPEYLTVSLPAETEAGAQTVTMTLTPQLVLHEEVACEVTVTWTDGAELLYGLFRVTLPAVLQEDLPVEEEPEAGETEEETPPTEEEPTTQTEEEQTEEPTEPTDEPTEETTEVAADVTLTGLSRFDLSGLLPVTLSGTAGEVTLGQAGEGEDVLGLPAFTRYSTDQGETYTLLYHESVITLALAEGESQLLLLDFSGAAVTEGTALTLRADRGTADLTTQAACVLEKQQQAQSPRVLNQKTSVAYTLPSGWEDCTMEVSVAMLTGDAEGNPVYQPVTLGEAGSLVVTEETAGTETDETEETQTTLTVQAGATRPLPGTYRITIHWLYEGCTIARLEDSFFVNYVDNAAQ